MYGSLLLHPGQSSVPASTHMLYWISFSDLMLSVNYLSGALTDLIDGDRVCGGITCKLIAAHGQFFSYTTVLWSGSLALNLQRTVVRPQYMCLGDDVRLMRWLNVSIWGCKRSSL